MDVTAINGSLFATNNTKSLVWRITRAIKKAGGTYRASGDGTSKDTSANPASDLWNGAGGSIGSGAAASTGTLDRGRLTITGLTGMTADSVGNYLTISGAASGGNNGSFLIVEYTSATEVVIRNSSGVASDANNGAISWSEIDPMAEAYPSALDSVSCWWHGYGVPIVRVPVNTASTGTFLRGEKVVQTTTNAEAELLGFMYDSVTPGNSFLVLLPRLGTFNGSDIITGDLTGATITPSGASAIFEAEFVFWGANNIHSGTIYYSRSTSTDTTLNSLVGTAGCVATIPPGGGGTGNAFPATAYAVRGTGGSAAHASWVYDTAPGNGKYQLVVANMIPSTDVSPDGTFWVMLGRASLGSTESSGFGYFRMDNTEEGDVDPYLWYCPGVGRSRTANTASLSFGTWSNSAVIWGNGTNKFGGWRRRGFSSGDDFQFYDHANLVYVGAGQAIIDTFGTPETVACQTNSLAVREPVWAGVRSASKHRKGSLRWWFQVPTGTAYSTWGPYQWVQVFTPTASFPGLILGPWDGSSDPVQT
jgi:hypothetical protein